MIKEVMTGTYVRNGEIIEFKFFDNLNTVEKINFIKKISDILVGENYNIVLKDMLFDFYLVSMMTDIDFSDMKDVADNIGYIEDFLECTNAVDILKANTKDGLIDELNKALDMNLEYRTGVKMNSLNDALASLLSTIENKIDGIDIEEMMPIIMSLKDVVGQIDSNQIVEAYINQTFKNE